MSKKNRFKKTLFFISCFATLNLAMYFTIQKFWIGGSSFLPMIGKLGPGKKFLFAFVVNLGVIVGAFISSTANGDFCCRFPKKNNVPKAILGGTLIGIGVTLAPGTCTTAFVIGIPMLSLSSFLSAFGILIGAYIMFKIMLK